MKTILLLLLTTTILQAQSDAIKMAWSKAKTHANNRDYAAAKPYLLTVYEEMPRPLCCYFLGVAYDLEGEIDSAAYYYQKCMKNSRKPQIRAWENLTRMYLRQLRFDDAYKMAREGLDQYPGNAVVLDEFKQICLWAYWLEYGELDKQYLTDYTLKENYDVGTVVEQELIIKNIRNQEDQFLHVGNRLYKGTFEEWNCRFNNSKKNIVIKFDLTDQNLARQLKKVEEKARAVYNDKEVETMLRIGAFLSLTPLSDKDMKNLLLAEQEEIRLCACTEMNANTSNAIQKKCQKDSSELVQKTLTNLDKK